MFAQSLLGGGTENAVAKGQRAQQVCLTCKARKKTCDKTLPACDFCTTRKLVCRYPTAPSKARYTENGAGKNFTVLTLPCSTEYQNVEDFEPLTIPIFQSSPFSPLSTAKGSPSVDESVHRRVHQILERAHFTLDDISERYFGTTSHVWLPIIAPSLFYQRASNYRGDVPSADFSVLVFMCFVTIFDPRSTDSHLSQDFLYTTSKSLFMQAQTAHCASIPLIQAACIITAYEYACFRPEAAYISLGTCINMARVLGIIGATPLQDRLNVDTITRLEHLERSNLSWAISMLERIILCEINQKDMRPLTEWPGPDSLLPSDLQTAEQLEAELHDIEAPRATLSTLHATNVGIFGRQAQAVSLLDQYLCITRSSADKPSTVLLSELQQLDSKIQVFFSRAVNDDYITRSIRCPACAISIRSLFLTHGAILSLLQDCQTEAEDQIGRSSMAALKTGCKIIVDVSKFGVDDQRHNGVAAIPICCSYNYRAAIEYLQAYNKQVGCKELEQEISYVLATENSVRRRWMF